MSDRLHALIFNALTQGLEHADRFVSLTEREAITRRIVAVVRGETAADTEAMERRWVGP